MRPAGRNVHLAGESVGDVTGMPRKVLLAAFLVVVLAAVWSLSLPADAQEPQPAGGQEVSPRRLVRIVYRDRAELADLDRQGADIWEVHPGYAIAAMPGALIATARLAGASLEDLGPVQPLNTFDPAYHTYSEMVTELQAVAAAHPDLVRLYDIGDGWEKTKGRADRDLWAVKVTANPDQAGGRPAVLFVSNHHAREIATTEVALQLLNLLVTAYGQDAEITYLLDTRAAWIVPMANPDGHARAEAGLDWRKNADDDNDACSGYSPPFSFGIDLNRNFSYHWGEAGTHPCDITYQGPLAFSEPENQALRQLMTTTAFSLVLSYHSYGDYVLYPWGYTTTVPPDAGLFAAISGKMASYNGYRPGQSSRTLYTLTGDLCDWAYGAQNIPCLVVEMGERFDPPQSALPGLWDENRPGALYLLKLAGDLNRAYGPEATGVSVTAWPGGLTLTATLSDTATGGQIVTAAEYFVDVLGSKGGGTPMLPADGAWDASQEMAVAVLPPLPPGRHTLLVQGRYAAGNWGTVAASFWTVPWHSYLPVMLKLKGAP